MPWNEQRERREKKKKKEQGRFVSFYVKPRIVTFPSDKRAAWHGPMEFHDFTLGCGIVIVTRPARE